MATQLITHRSVKFIPISKPFKMVDVYERRCQEKVYHVKENPALFLIF